MAVPSHGLAPEPQNQNGEPAKRRASSTARLLVHVCEPCINHEVEPRRSGEAESSAAMKKSRKILAISSMLLFLIAVRPGYRMNRTFAQKQTQEDRLSSGYVPGRLLVKFHGGASAAETGNLITGMGVRRTGEIEQIGLHILELPAGADEEAFAHAFRERPEVAFAELDVIRPPADIIPNDPSYTNEWHLPRIAGPTAWPISTGSSSVTIAICDTGVEGTHPDLISKMVAGWNFYDNNSNTADVYGHGTAVAGTAA